MKYRKAPAKRPEKYKTPSEFGSHQSMMATVEQLAEYGLDSTEQELAITAGNVLLVDEKGLYCTKITSLDTGFADVRRFNSERYYRKVKE